MRHGEKSTALSVAAWLYLACWLLALAALFGLLPVIDRLPLGERFFGFVTGVWTLVAGLGILFVGLPRASAAFKLPVLVLLVFLAGFNWITFGPGERVYTRQVVGSMAVGGTLRQTAGKREAAPEGAIVFGLFTLLLEGGLVLSLRQRMRRGG